MVLPGENMKQTILVVDDDKKTVELVRLYLEQEDYIVSTAYHGRQALDLIREQSFDLITLDWMLPHVDGLSLCRIAHKEKNIPVIMLTARTTEEHMLLGLGEGADDYVTKPFSLRELAARVRVVLRRAAPLRKAEELDRRSINGLCVDFLSHEVRLHGELIALTPTEFRLLAVLMHAPGRVFSRQELLERAFGEDYERVERTIDVHLMNLRKKIEPRPDEPIYVQTVYGVGYKFRRNHATI
jgi:DNA-binding response OmpR family regulator